MDNQLSIYTLITKSRDVYAGANETYVGIDFGTSTTIASICSIDENKHIKTTPISFKQSLADGRFYEHYLLPSVIALVDNRLLIGKGAYDLKYKLQEGINLWHSFKMELGIDEGPKYYNSELCSGHPSGTIETPHDATKIFFNFVKQGISEAIKTHGLSSNIRYAVSIPAGFEANQRRALIKILQEIGLSDERHVFIDEPNAAFINYLVEFNDNNFKHYQIPDDSPLHILVFDFGAGTCDISILAIKNTGHSFSTKNVAISSFLPLGGNDIDKAVARQILLPQLLTNNKVDVDKLKKIDVDKRILPKLLGIAERLKINLCKNISAQVIKNNLPSLALSDKTVKITENNIISLPKMTLQLGDFYLSYAEFSKLMRPFLDPFSRDDSCSEEGNIVSIFSPINSALNKAELNINNIDLLLMIGGSAQNPYVIDALRNEFSDLDIEIPQNFQSHVSGGTSVYSKLIHGIGFDIIQPITSEPLLYMTKEGIKVLVPANSPIPSNFVLFDQLQVANDRQKVIEIPVFISSSDKLLHVIRATEQQGKEFFKNTIVQLNVKITENKLVEVQIIINNSTIAIEYLNPFANHKLSPKERNVYDKRKDAYISAKNNNGRPTTSAISGLANAYADADQHLEAAELLENLQKMQPNNTGLLTSLCYHYARAGKTKKSLEWAKQAYERNKTSITAFNFALEFKNSNEERYCELMEEGLKINSEAVFILQVYGCYLMDKNDSRGETMLSRALKLLSSELNAGIISDEDLNRLIICARRLDASEILKKAIKKRDSLKQIGKDYDDKNLLKSSYLQLKQV